jgi:hypothetical protein
MSIRFAGCGPRTNVVSGMTNSGLLGSLAGIAVAAVVALKLQPALRRLPAKQSNFYTVVVWGVLLVAVVAVGVVAL